MMRHDAQGESLFQYSARMKKIDPVDLAVFQKRAAEEQAATPCEGCPGCAFGFECLVRRHGEPPGDWAVRMLRFIEGDKYDASVWYEKDKRVRDDSESYSDEDSCRSSSEDESYSAVPPWKRPHLAFVLD